MRDLLILNIVRTFTGLLGLLVTLLQIGTIVIVEEFPHSSYGRGSSRNAFLIVIAVIVFFTSIYLLFHAVASTQWAQKRVRFLTAWFGQGLKVQQRIGIFSVFVTALNIIAAVTTLFLTVNVGYMNWLVIPASESKDPSALAITVKVLSAVILGLQVLFVSLLVVCLWWPAMMFTDCLIGILSTLQFLTSISTITLDFNEYRKEPSSSRLHLDQVYVALSLFLCCAAFVGAGLIFTVRAHNRLSQQTSRLAGYYIFVCSLSATLCFTWFLVSLDDVGKVANTDSFQQQLTAYPILAFCGMIMNFACIWCATRLRHTPKTKLRVQEYDLSGLSATELKAWAALIDAYSVQNGPDAAKGFEALDLMKAYVESPMPGFHCKVLRVYDDKIADTEKQEKGQSYDHVRAWEELDDIALFQPTAESDSSSLRTLFDLDQKQSKPMSKNAIKKAQKKAAKKTKGIAAPDFNEKTPEEIEKEQQFRIMLMSTEALILLTMIDEYDLTSPLKGRMGTILRHTLGSKSWFKPLCVRFGILGTHWPFRQMIFYTAPTKKPTARTAAILAAISVHNDSLPSSERCSLLYNPCYGSARNDKTLKMSGWLSMPGAPSHVIDLRAYRNKSLAEYLRAIKYRNQASAFKAANGQVVETKDFTPENCATAMRLWANIAEKRTSEGHTAVLKDPNEAFLRSLGETSHNENGYRQLLFLKVDDEYIASCVLFFLGNTVTSDMQGLDHEKARQYKAYFVMMQETITIALREGISFVDFGPTTAKPKLDIGCSEIPLLGGFKSREPLATLIKLCAGQVDV